MRLISQLMPSVGDIRSTFGRVPRDLGGEGVRRVAIGRQRCVMGSSEANPGARVGVLVNVTRFTLLLARGHASGRQDVRTRVDRPAIHAPGAPGIAVHASKSSYGTGSLLNQASRHPGIE